MVIAIDGPAGAGKSTVARAVARELGITYLDSGAMYRCVALACLRQGADPAEPGAASDLAASIEIGFEPDRVLLGGEDVSGEIRSPEVSRAASLVSAHPGVRRSMVALQRAMIAEGGYVAEGRDIGTEVSPDSPLKVYLDATARVRAERRAAQTGRPVERVLADQAERDRRDCEREHGALRVADGAIEIDTSEMSADEVAAEIAGMARQRGLA